MNLFAVILLNGLKMYVWLSKVLLGPLCKLYKSTEIEVFLRRLLGYGPASLICQDFLAQASNLLAQLLTRSLAILKKICWVSTKVVKEMGRYM